MEAKDYFAGAALLISLVSLVVAVVQRRPDRIESVIAGLRGDRRAVTYAALTIRLSRLLVRSDYRRSLIASLLLAWNFESSDRARAAVLAALVDARRDFRSDYDNVVADLEERFTEYERSVEDGDIQRGRSRLNDVTTSVEIASRIAHVENRASQEMTTSV
jgi:hypothetical protein